MTLEELRELERAATEGPWGTKHMPFSMTDYMPECTLIHGPDKTPPWVADLVIKPEDAALIAALRNAAPALLEFAAAVEYHAMEGAKTERHATNEDVSRWVIGDACSLRAALSQIEVSK